MVSKLCGFPMAPGGDPHILDGLPRLLFLQRIVVEVGLVGRVPDLFHTLLRSGACGLEGLTGTESPAADGIYITGPVCVGLDTAEDCCKSSLSAGCSTCAKAQKGPRGQLPDCCISLHLVDL